MLRERHERLPWNPGGGVTFTSLSVPGSFPRIRGSALPLEEASSCRLPSSARQHRRPGGAIGAGGFRGTSLAGRTASVPNRRAIRSTACSASRQPAGRSSNASCRAAAPAGRRPAARTPTSRSRARAIQPGPLVQRARGRVDLPGHVGRLGERPRPGDGLEAGQPELHGHGPRHAPGGAQRPRRPAGQPQQLPADHLRVVDVRRGMSPRRRRSSPPGAGSPGARPCPRRGPTGARRAAAELPPQGGLRNVRDITHGAQAEPGQDFLGAVAHPPQRAGRQRVQELEQPVRPGPRAARPACSGPTRSWPRT